MSAIQSQYVSPLGQIVKDQALNQLATGDMSAVTQTPAVNSSASTPSTDTTGVTVNARRGIFTIYTGNLGGRGSRSFTFQNSHIKETSIVLIGVAQYDVYGSLGGFDRPHWVTAHVIRAQNGSANVVLANSGNGSIDASAPIKLWFIVLDL